MYLPLIGSAITVEADADVGLAQILMRQGDARADGDLKVSVVRKRTDKMNMSYQSY